MSMSSTDKQSNAIRHFAITGPSAEALREFYAFLGFIHLVKEEVPEPEYIAALTGGKWSGAVILKLSNARGQVLEIIEPVLPEGGENSKLLFGWSHLAFTVNDCEASVNAVRSKGGILVGGPEVNPQEPFKVAYVRDPAGNLIELVEALN